MGEGVPPERPRWLTVADGATLGLEMGISVALGVAGGLWLDRRLGTRYWGLVGLLVGIGAAGRALWRVAARARREAEREAAAARASGPGESISPDAAGTAAPPAAEGNVPGEETHAP
ncbi:MAG: AtpZ/AtpI family protein [Myxococcota bacterium]|nr:AtpZ/AtpI family protein [Myxococcota bacterium]